MLEFDTPLQTDLFTGELVDTRTRQQKQADSERWRNVKQLEMFSQREVALFGVRANPIMPLSPGRLVLVAEDPRSEDEIERDLLHEAESLTTPLPLIETPPPVEAPQMDDSSPVQVDVTTIDEPVSADEVEETEVEPEAPIVITPYVAYVALVEAATERSATISQSPTSAIGESIQMSEAKLNARLAGLNGDEIATALRIGEVRGRTLPSASPTGSSVPDGVLETPDLPQQDWDVPVLWTNRAAMLKRRPDLAPAIAALRNDEVEALAALLADALEEFYWIQLNVILSLSLDHELQLFKRVAGRNDRRL